MKIKFGSLVVAGSGKIGGHVASKNRAGSYLRTKVTPINRDTTAQALVRSRLSAISSSWKALNAASIIAWNNAVSSYKGTNVFGDVVSPTGSQLYQRLNNNLELIGESPITVPPLPVAVGNMGALTLTAAKAVPAIALAFTTPIVSGERVKIYATAGVSAGKSFVKSEYRFIGYLVTGDTTPKNILSMYTAKFGAIPSAGLQVFIRAINVNLTTGQPGIALQASCIVAS